MAYGDMRPTTREAERQCWQLTTEEKNKKIERLKELVKDAYIEGLNDDRYTDVYFEIKSWRDSKTKQALNYKRVTRYAIFDQKIFYKVQSNTICNKV